MGAHAWLHGERRGKSVIDLGVTRASFAGIKRVGMGLRMTAKGEGERRHCRQVSKHGGIQRRRQPKAGAGCAVLGEAQRKGERSPRDTGVTLVSMSAIFCIPRHCPRPTTGSATQPRDSRSSPITISAMSCILAATGRNSRPASAPSTPATHPVLGLKKGIVPYSAVCQQHTHQRL
jgi:hypothetical protein